MWDNLNMGLSSLMKQTLGTSLHHMCFRNLPWYVLLDVTSIKDIHGDE